MSDLMGLLRECLCYIMSVRMPGRLWTWHFNRTSKLWLLKS